MIIQCISDRLDHRDRLYNTGAWSMFQLKVVPDAVGLKMITHRDVYVEVDGEPTDDMEHIVTEAGDLYDEMQEFYDKLYTMSKEQMKDFVEVRFGVKVDLRNYANLDKLRDYTRMLVDQYGLKA